MRKQDKNKNMEQANLMLEQSYLKSKRLLKEFDYEPHKNPDIEIISRTVVSINPGTRDVLEVEGILARNNKEGLFVFKPLTKVKIFQSSDSRKLIKDKEINLNQADTNTSSAVNLLNNNINKWLFIKTDHDDFGIGNNIKFNENIDVKGYGTSFIGNLNCIFNNIKFERI